MIGSQSNEWNWNYSGDTLSMCFRLERGTIKVFNTHYKIRELQTFPSAGQPFCCKDAELLTAYQEGLSELGLNEDGCLDLGINAVACERFVRPSAPVTRLFFSFGDGAVYPAGSVVTVYTLGRQAGDCLVLEERDSDGLARLMLLNPKLDIGRGLAVTLGHMIRVNPAILCSFRAYSVKEAEQAPGLNGRRYA
ncbi:MAG: cell division protein ZapC [Succinivibrio sp.]|nr:cell division protein ZapC [Succinivibrio sp.]